MVIISECESNGQLAQDAERARPEVVRTASKDCSDHAEAEAEWHIHPCRGECGNRGGGGARDAAGGVASQFVDGLHAAQFVDGLHAARCACAWWA